MPIKDVERVLITEEEINKIVDKIAGEINRDFVGEEVYLVCIMKGSMIFTADLARRLNMPVYLDFMQVSSYNDGSKTSGNITIKRDLEMSVEGKNVIVVEDIVDSGHTLNTLKALLAARNAECVKLCSFLDKPSRREVAVKVDYVGMQIPDEFVIGYGLDYAQKYRNLPYVGILKRSVYEN